MHHVSKKIFFNLNCCRIKINFFCFFVKTLLNKMAVVLQNTFVLYNCLDYIINCKFLGSEYFKFSHMYVING